MARHDKACPTCGAAFTTKFSRQVYCEPCQCLRDLNYGIAPRNCDRCEQKFWPIRKTYTLCADCFVQMPGGNTGTRTDCKKCTERKRSAPGTDAWCLSCVQESEKNRKLYRTYLRKRAGASPT